MYNINNTVKSYISRFNVDNAANLYAAVRRKNWCRTYTMEITLDTDIIPCILTEALSDTLKRFPTFSAVLHDGIFWPHFEHTNFLPHIGREKDYPYRPLTPDITKNGVIRVLYNKNKISIDFFHGACDGHSALTFLCTLIGRYLEKCGIEHSYNDIMKSVNSELTGSELSDDYLRYADSSPASEKPTSEKAYIYAKPTDKSFVRVLHINVPTSEMKSACTKYNLSPTEYFSAALVCAFIREQKKVTDENIIISIPVDLRQFFPSESMRNFVYAVPLSFNPKGRKDVTLGEVAECFRGKIREQATKENMQAIMNRNVSAAKKSNFIPWQIKRLVLKSSYKANQQSYTTVLSSFGKLTLPEDAAVHIKNVCIIAGATPYADFNCAAITYNGEFRFTAGTSSRECAVFNELMKILEADGIDFKAQYNTDTDADNRAFKKHFSEKFFEYPDIK